MSNQYFLQLLLIALHELKLKPPAVVVVVENQGPILYVVARH